VSGNGSGQVHPQGLQDAAIVCWPDQPPSATGPELLADYGIDDISIKRREQVTQGTSALFLLTGQVTLDKIDDVFIESKAELIQSNLTFEQEEKLKQAFGE
jgi:uncharacterized membrane protein